MAKEIQFQDSTGEKYYPLPSWPIGSIYISVINTNPKAYFGGTWEQIAKGRTLVGVDPSQVEFNTVKKTGGSKHLQRHTHTLKGSTAGASNKAETVAYGSFISGTEMYALSESGIGDSGNLQPYFTCYIWLRIA